MMRRLLSLIALIFGLAWSNFLGAATYTVNNLTDKSWLSPCIENQWEKYPNGSLSLGLLKAAQGTVDTILFAPNLTGAINWKDRGAPGISNCVSNLVIIGQVDANDIPKVSIDISNGAPETFLVNGDNIYLENLIIGGEIGGTGSNLRTANVIKRVTVQGVTTYFGDGLTFDGTSFGENTAFDGDNITILNSTVTGDLAFLGTNNKLTNSEITGNLNVTSGEVNNVTIGNNFTLNGNSNIYSQLTIGGKLTINGEDNILHYPERRSK